MRKCFIIVAFLLVGLAHTQDVHFAAYDIVIDGQGQELAAWQCELTYNKKQVAIVGIEGGEGAPFPANKPPFYDPRGMKSGRIVLAAFGSSKKALPSGKFRIARVHLQITGKAKPDLAIRLVTAANRKGQKISGKISIHEQKKREDKK